MDQEPPSKRRRTDDQYVEDWFDVVDDADDFVVQSFGGVGLDAKDEGYRLSIERAYSDVRFQSTMAHIFEKYGRDFDGIGDEIDLMTGEIVVDNGHIHNMRNEIDVGDDFLFQQRQQQHEITLQLQQSQLQFQQQQQQQQRQQEEEDAMLWKEFTYTNEEEEDEDGTTPQDKDDSPSTHEDDSDERAQGDHEQHDRTDQNGQTISQSMALVPRAAAGPPGAFWAHQQPQPQLPAIMPGAFWPGPSAISPYAFGAPPMALAPSPYTMFPPPFAAAAPWNMPLPFRGPQWTLPPAEMPRRNLTGHRYKFKAQKGTSSIWAVRSRYKEAEDEPLRSVFNMALGKHLSQSSPRAIKGLPAPPDRRRLTYHDDNEEDEGPALSGTAKRKRGRPRKHSPEKKAPPSNEEDRVGRGRRRSSSRKSARFQSASLGSDPEDIPTSTQPTRTRGRPRRPKPAISSPARENATDEERHDDETTYDSTDHACHADAHIQHEPTQAGDSLLAHRTRNRRYSTRNSEQVEPPREAPPIRSPQKAGCQIFRIEIPAINAGSWEEYQAVEMVDASESEPAPSNEKPDAIAPDPEPTPSRDAISERTCLDDDQDTALSSSNEPSCRDSTGDDASEVTATTEPDKPSEMELPKAADTACVFSDDEAPIILSKVKVPRRGKRGRIPEKSRPDPPEAPGQEAHEDAARDAPIQPAADNSGAHEPVAQASHDLPRSDDTAPGSREGRQDAGSDAADIASDPEPQETRHDTGADTGTESASVPPPPGYPSGAVPLSSSPTRSLARFTAKVSLNDQTPRLGREARWLRKNAASFQLPGHDVSSSPAGEDALPRPRRRSMSRKSLSIAEQHQQQQPENPEHAPETEHHPAPSSPAARALLVPDRAHVSFVDAAPPSQDEPAAPSHHNPAAPRPGSKTPKTPARRSILSLAPAHSASDADADIDIDELGRSLAALMPTAGPTPRSTTARKRWKSSARTTEVYRTPVRVRARPGAPASPDSVVRTPGGTLRVCGVDGYRCGRDFCFTCL